jgi:hypothetical protein
LWCQQGVAQSVEANEYSAEAYGLGSVAGRAGALLYAGTTRRFAATDTEFNSYQGAAVATLRLLPAIVEAWAGFLYRHTDYHAATNQNEYRPFVVLFAATDQTRVVRFSTLNRAEYLFKTAVDGSEVDDYWRLRPRVAFDFPLRGTDWTRGTSYGVVDFEPLFEIRDDSATVDELRIRFGLGYLMTEHWIAEALWTMSLHAAEEGPLAWDRNMFRFRVKYRWENLGRAVAAGLDF